MARKHGFVALASTAAVSSCVPGGGGIGDALNWAAIMPSQTQRLTYADTLEFDKALHASLKGNTPIVTVGMPTPKTTAVDALAPGALLFSGAQEVLLGADVTGGSHRLAPWVNLPSVAGGKTHWCSDQGVSRGYMGAAAEALAAVVKYEPARDYSAVVVYDSSDRVQYVRFVYNAPDTMTCADAIAMAAPPA